jgi:hypothetical protein
MIFHFSVYFVVVVGMSKLNRKYFLIKFFYIKSLKDYLPKEYIKVKGIEKKIFLVSFAKRF